METNSPFLLQMLKDIQANQRATMDKLDAFHEYLLDHTEQDNQNFSDVRERLAHVDERLKSHSARWGFVATIITAIVSTSAFQFIRTLIK